MKAVEIERNIKKMPEALALYKKYLPLLNLEIVPLPSSIEVYNLAGCISDKDISVLASAIKCSVDFLVTRDKKDFLKAEVKRRHLFRILTPSEFLDTILPEVLKSMDT